MGSFFRSEEMCLVQLFFQTESAHHCINELGNLGLVQFRDLNPGVAAFQRRFVKEVEKFKEMERILSEYWIPTNFEKLEWELKEINFNRETLKQNFTELKEMNYLLHMTEDFFQEAEPQLLCAELPSEESVSAATSSLCTGRFVAGVINHERFQSFEKILWRVFHGNFFLRHTEIQPLEDDNLTEWSVKKDVFIIFIQGEQVRGKIRKICEGFHASLYPCPDITHAREEMRTSINTRIADLRVILKKTEEYRMNVLKSAAANLQEWTTKVKRMKAIYFTLNLCNIDITQKLIVAEVWCPVADLSTVRHALVKGSEQSGCTLSPVLNRIETSRTPPTFNRTNVFTSGFQNIVDAYGIGEYQEMNPAPYTIVTFPFLFAVMFGDCGHGLIMTAFAAWLILKEEHFRKMKSELTSILFGGRYIILLMGIFSVYTGLIYNDCFSKSFNLFGSSWSVRAMLQPHGPWSNETLQRTHQLQLDPAMFEVFSGSPYIFGIDPIWSVALNKLTFLNSYKMKMSVILGVTHMVFGVVLSLMNFIDFSKIFLQFVPELIFMLFIFGYLVFLILFKWCVALKSDKAPSILLLFINMMLFDYGSEESLLFTCQKPLQIFLVVVAFLMVPWLLMAKPLLIYRRHKKQVNPNYGCCTHDEDIYIHNHLHMVNAESSSDCEVSMGDVFVYQAIHTIEYCLGCISNTASYLRLWALSLAHAELSEVLWKMVLQPALRVTSDMGFLLVVVAFAAFAVLTVTVLLLMEGLSAFLHALRLHWVEFQNKFYKGSGYKFTPLVFDNIFNLQQ
uniref:V-type proton ATPase subunit a n=1 Tax=Denticeps clupeoides TaxID=299321 RepID=A0AAY4AL25_9TELE